MTDCITWTGYKAQNGYGYVVVDGKNIRAHRFTWEQKFGPIPDGLVLDHICHNEAAKNGECVGGFDCQHRLCVNLDHLQAVTQRENIMNGLHSIDVKECCPKGHSYKVERNIMIRKSGKRECAECNRNRANAVYARRMQVA